MRFQLVKKILATAFLACACAGFSLNADEVERKDGEHFQVGTEAVSHNEAVKIEERRIRQEEDGVKSLKLAKPSKKSYVNYNMAFFHAAVHYMDTKNYDGSAITMEDDSLWGISYYDHDVVKYWYTGDSLIVAPNSTWLSDYKYEIYNQNVGTKIRANILEGGHIALTRYITMVDTTWKRVYLSDGTCWQISFWDDDLISHWPIGSGVMIGVNNKWDHNSSPYILIDIEANQYARAKLIN